MLADQWSRFRAFIAPFHDLRAWTLIVVCVGGVWVFDPVMAKTVPEWLLISGAFGGFGVIICRHLLPQIDLASAVSKAMDDNPVAAGLVVLSTALFLSALVLSLTLWAKA